MDITRIAMPMDDVLKRLGARSAACVLVELTRGKGRRYAAVYNNTRIEIVTTDAVALRRAGASTTAPGLIEIEPSN